MAQDVTLMVTRVVAQNCTFAAPKQAGSFATAKSILLLQNRPAFLLQQMIPAPSPIPCPRGSFRHHRRLQFPLFFSVLPAIWDLANSRPVHSLLSFHLYSCLPCLPPPFTVPCKMVWPDLMNGKHDHTTAVCVFTIVRRSSCGPFACWILARTSSLVTWSLYEMCSIWR